MKLRSIHILPVVPRRASSLFLLTFFFACVAAAAQDFTLDGVRVLGSNRFPESEITTAAGLKIGEPAADLAVAAALVSALTQQPVPAEMVVFGEIGLSGEVRAVSHADQRLKEAGKLGFSSALMPRRRAAASGGRGGKSRSGGSSSGGGILAQEIGHLRDLVALFTESPRRPAAAHPWRHMPIGRARCA